MNKLSDDENLYKDFGEGWENEDDEDFEDPTEKAYDEAFRHKNDPTKNKRKKRSEAGNVLNYEKMTKMEFEDYLEGNDEDL